MSLIPAATGTCVPHLDGFVPSSSRQHVSDLRVPVTGKNMVVVCRPLSLTPVRASDVPQLHLACFRDGGELPVAVRVELHIPDRLCVRRKGELSFFCAEIK